MGAGIEGAIMITAVATQVVVPGKEKPLIDLMATLTAQVKANEPGCTLFLYVKSVDKPQTYLVIEQYKDQAAFDFHHQTSYLNNFIPKMMACLHQPPDVVTCSDVFNQ
jgi:quinol monooxygenase YgiN